MIEKFNPAAKLPPRGATRPEISACCPSDRQSMLGSSKKYKVGLMRAALLALTAGSGTTAYSALEEVVVTAQKHEQGVNDVGMTVNAFSGETLRNFGVTTAWDIPSITPGLTVNEVSATGVPVYTIRGVGFQDQSTGSSSTVGLYFDEVSIPYTVMSRGTLFDLARVEVLKGPQGDLYGRNTTAGQINFISNKPTEDFEAGFTASYGRFEVLDVVGYASGAITDGIQGRLSFNTVKAGEGSQDSLTQSGETLGKQDVGAVRGLINFDISENASLLWNVHYTDDQSENRAATAYDGRIIGLNETGNPYIPLNEYVLPGGSNFGETPPWYNNDDTRKADWTNWWTSPITGDTYHLKPHRDNQLWGTSAKLEWAFDDITLTSLTAYDSFERKEAGTADGVFTSVQEVVNNSDIRVFSQELRLTGQSDKLLWIAGAYYSNDTVDEQFLYFMQDSFFGDGSAAFHIPSPFARTPIYQLDTRYKQETEALSGFGHIEYNLTEQLRLTLGTRFTHEERDWSGCTYDAGDGTLASLWNASFHATLQPGACAILDDTPGSPTNITNVIGTPQINSAFHRFTTDISEDKWMWRAGLDYAFTDDVLVYGTWSLGFKSGGFNGGQVNATSQLVPYKPEQLTSYELGAKTTFFDSTMQLNVSAFYYDYKDKQELELSPTPVGMLSFLGNIPKSEVWGSEIEMQWAPLDGLNVNLSAAYLDSEIKKWETVVGGRFDFQTGQPTDLVYKDAAGEPLPQSPEWSYHALVRYEWPISDGLTMDVGADANYTDSAADPVRAQASIESYTLVNARIGISDAGGKWRAGVWGRNLTDEYYYQSGTGGINGAYVRYAGMPITYGISLEYNY